MLNVLVFEEEPALRNTLSAFLRDDACRVVAPANFSEAANAVMQENFDIILCGHRVGETDALSFFHIIQDRQKTAVKVLMTEHPTRATQDEIRWAGIDYVIHMSAVFKCMETLKFSLVTASHVRRTEAAH